MRTWLLRRALLRSTAIVVQNHSDGGIVGRSPRLRIAGRATRRAVDATFRLLTDGVGVVWGAGDAGECARALAAAAARDLAAERVRLVEHFSRAVSWDAV